MTTSLPGHAPARKSAPSHLRGLPSQLTPTQQAILDDAEQLLQRAARVLHVRPEAPDAALVRCLFYVLTDVKHYREKVRRRGGRLAVEQPGLPGAVAVVRYQPPPAPVVDLAAYRARRAAGGAR